MSTYAEPIVTATPVPRAIPVSPGFVVPQIQESAENTVYFQVGDERFTDEKKARAKAKRLKSEAVRHQGQIPVYNVNGDSFVNMVDAEKKVASILKAHRDQVREAVRLFGVDKASQAEKLPAIKWLVEHYPVEDLRRVNFLYAVHRFNEDFLRSVFAHRVEYIKVIVRSSGNFYKLTEDELVDPMDKSYPIEFFFETYPYNEELEYVDGYNSLIGNRADLNLNRIKIDRTWGWLQNRALDDWSIPMEFSDVGEGRSQWIREVHDLEYRKLELVKQLVNYRLGELLSATAQQHAVFDANGTVSMVMPLEDVLLTMDYSLVLDELEEIVAFLHTAERGLGFDIAVVKGQVRYWIHGDKKALDPFKKF
jgi:hypothetical protein